MDSLADNVEVLDSSLEDKLDSSVIAEYDRWQVRECIFDTAKIQWIWDEMKKYDSLFSDLTKGSAESFVNLICSPFTIWLEVIDTKAPEHPVGLIYATDTQRIIDCEVHILFFDRKPQEKAPLVKMVLEWAFNNYPFRRMTTSIPAFYYATIRLTEKLGFKHEGRRREALMLGNKWVDEVILGILRQEVL